MVEAQTHRRSLKTHLPVDALVYSSKAKYIYVARDGRGRPFGACTTTSPVATRRFMK